MHFVIFLWDNVSFTILLKGHADMTVVVEKHFDKNLDGDEGEVEATDFVERVG